MLDGDLRIEPGSLRKLVQASRTWDAVTKREFRAGLRAAASQGAAAAQAEVRGPVPGLRSGKKRRADVGGLRSALAGGVKVSISTGRENKLGVVTGEGVRVTASGAKLPADKAPMVKAYMAKEFRHPVFGNKKRFVTQKGKNWFYKPLFAGREQYQKAVIDAIETAAQAIVSE